MRERASAYDVELTALAMGIAHASRLFATCSDLTSLHIFVDNKLAAHNILQPGIHPGQLSSIHAIRSIRTLLSADASRRVSINRCPAHVGMAANKFVDQLAKDGLNEEQPDFVSFSMARSNATAHDKSRKAEGRRPMRA